MEVVPGLYCLSEVGWGVNAYLWWPGPAQVAEGAPLLFDCGWPWSGQGLARSLARLGLHAGEIHAVAITHDDIDHTGRLAVLQAVSGATVIAHALEAVRLASTSWREPPGNRGPINLVMAAAKRFYQRWPHHPVQVTCPVADGDKLPGGWMAVHAPGHTPGHTAYFHPGLPGPDGLQRVLVAGDALGHSGGGRLRLPTPIYTEDMNAAIEAIGKLANLAPDIICFGHGPVLRNAAEPLRRFADSLFRQYRGYSVD